MMHQRITRYSRLKKLYSLLVYDQSIDSTYHIPPNILGVSSTKTQSPNFLVANTISEETQEKKQLIEIVRALIS